MLPATEIRALVLGARAAALLTRQDAPLLSHASAPPLRALMVSNEHGERREIHLPIERALRVILDAEPSVTLMTLAAAPEFLVLGYLYNQGTIRALTDITALNVDLEAGTARVTFSSAYQPAAGAPNAGTGNACGLGRAALALARLPPQTNKRADVIAILEAARVHDDIHRAAGSVHSGILFEGSELLIGIEDVSRHNGIDTLAGWMLLHGVEGGGKLLFTTGRLTAEMVAKAAHMGIGTMISRNGTTAAGCDLAVQLGMILIGRAANRRFLVYTGEERLLP